MISVCCTIRNRTKVDCKYGTLNLFPDCINSLKEGFEKANIEWELVLSDWKSTDTDYKWLPEHKLITISKKGFSRGYGLNVAAENAKYPNLFFTDTDMLIRSDFLTRCLLHCNNNKAYFPICWSIAEKDRETSRQVFVPGSEKRKPTKAKWNGRANRSGWRMAGRGMCSMKKTAWEQVGKWPEYWKWGSEDGDYARRFFKHKIPVVRERDMGLVHCWHPTMRT